MATLHKKTSGIIGATLIGMILIVYLGSHIIITHTFSKMEEKEASENAVYVKNIFLSECRELESTATHWSTSYGAFYQKGDNNNRSVEDYMSQHTFSYQGVDFIFCYNESGGYVSERILDNEYNNTQVLDEIEKHFQQNGHLTDHKDRNLSYTGFIVSGAEPVMITSLPLIKDDNFGHVYGTVIMGRVIDDDEIARLNEITDLTVNIGNISDHGLNKYDTGIPGTDNNDNANITFLISDDRIHSFAHFNDIYGNDAFSLEVNTDRDVHHQSFNILAYLLIILLLTGVFSGVSATTLLERSHISRLNRLQNEVTKISDQEDFSSRVSCEGDDELNDLGLSINNMLESLERSQDLVMMRDATINGILQAMPDMMFVVKKDGSISNYKLSTDSCIYESPETGLNITLDDVLPAHVAEMELEIIEEALRTNRIQTMQYSLPVRGEMRDFEVRFVVSGDDEVLAVVKDITEIKQAEEMHRKDLLLKEIHHRVKNNLQIISSLLRLQSRKFNDKDTVEAFRKSQNRAKSMAIAHEKLYQSHDLENIELEAYVETLTRYLLNTYSCDPEKIKIDINIKNITQGIDTAIPLGLMINEIVSNSLKHAFDDKGGEIRIAILPQDDGLYVMNIQDNGRGFPKDIDFMNTDSLGMQLVVSLVEQIEGSIELNRENGTEFRITFKELSYKRRDC